MIASSLCVIHRARRSFAISTRSLVFLNLEFGMWAGPPGRYLIASRLSLHCSERHACCVRYMSVLSLMMSFALEARDAAPVGRREHCIVRADFAKIKNGS